MGQKLNFIPFFVLTTLVLLLVSGIAGCDNQKEKSGGLINSSVISGDEISANTSPQNTASNSAEPQTKTIEITSSGFNPSPININAGDKVVFLNKDTTSHWPASAMHPTHTVYPGSDINKCGTSEQNNIFDACKGLKQGESFSFTFSQKGSWNYHDHLSPKLFGKVIVN